MGCKSCGGKVVEPVSTRTLGEVPQLEENQTLYLDYVAPGVGTYRPKGVVTGESYYFKTSPRNQRGKRVVHTAPPYQYDEINYDDALHFIDLKMANYNLFAWRVETAEVPEPIKETVEVEIVEPEVVVEGFNIEEIMTSTQSKPVESEEDTKVSIDTWSIGKAKKKLTDLTQVEYVQLLADEKEGSNRKGMVDFLESMING